jgi:alpha 1,3-glucosidase
VTADVLSSEHASPLKLELSFLQSGNVRFKVSEKNPRWQPTDLLLSAGLTAADFKKTDPSSLPGQWKSKDADSFVAYTFQGPHGENTVVLQLSPIRLEVFQDKDLVVVLNDRNLMHFEHRKSDGSTKTHEIKTADSNANVDRHKGKEVTDYGEDGLAIYADGTREEKAAAETQEVVDSSGSTTESFGGHTDTVPHGPTSVGIDISFPCASNIYGIPEHTTSLSLPTTIAGSANASPHYSNPYRLYNLDVFEYELQETMALYGNIPFLWGHGKCSASNKFVSAGIFFFNPSESFVDISDGKSSFFSSTFKESHWVLESGEIDIFIMTGPSPKDLSHEFATLVGTQQLPPLFSLGYHQCRWNYRDERDVAQVNAQFEALDYPYDVIWLDIEHTNGKRYFTVRRFLLVFFFFFFFFIE